MASIQISELRPIGADLFQDSESFLNELNDQEMTTAYGGQQFLSISNISIQTKNIKVSDINIGSVSISGVDD